VYVPHAIDNDRFAYRDYEHDIRINAWKKELGIEGCFSLLFAGKLESKKNPAYLLQLAAKMTDKNLRFIFVGNGVLEDSLKRQAQKDSRIIFMDFQNQQNMPLVYRLADVFVLPSIGPGETWGLAINEAMSCGLPIIASDKVGGAVDLINGNGIIVSPSDISSSVNYIQNLMSDKKYLKEQSSMSIDRVNNFSYTVLVNHLFQFLLKLELHRGLKK
jgi:glycosyltransferase involved in cell wall biosynthesis